MRKELAGDAGELAVLNYLQAQGQVLDVRQVRSWQRVDVDFVVPGVGTVEVKTDTFDSGNIALELARGEPGRPGCFLRSIADRWFYLLPAQGQALVMDRVQLLGVTLFGLMAGKYTCRQAKARTEYRGVPGAGGTYTVALVPVADCLTMSRTKVLKLTADGDALSIS